MRFRWNAAALVLMATLITWPSVGQVDPCDPGGAKFGTQDCPSEKKTVHKKSKKAVEAADSAKPAAASSPAPAPEPSSNRAASSKPATPAASTPEIAAAQSSGKVWVNTESGVYYKSGRWYGKTKQGKFMTESEAKAAGYKAAAKK